jgi:AraC family transcriptional regulator
MKAGSFRVSECVYTPGFRFPEHAHDRAGFCVVIEGGFSQRHGRRTISCDPASLLFCPADAPHADVISTRGSRCLEIDIDDAVLTGVPTFSPETGNRDPRRGLANWYAYKIRSEMHRPDALSPIVIEGAALALIGEFARQPKYVPLRQPPTWLERIRAGQ